MKRNTDSLPKFKALSGAIARPRYATIGVLEGIWDLAGKHAPRGNIGKFTNQEIAACLEWDGNPDLLIDALVSQRWLDTSEKHRLIVHDWKDHAPDWLKKTIARSGEGWASDDDSVCQRQPVAANGSQRQPTAASGGLPCLTLPSQTRPNQTFPAESEKVKETGSKAGRQAKTVAGWLKANRIDGPYLKHALGVDGLTVESLEEHFAKIKPAAVGNVAACAVWRACDELGHPPPKTLGNPFALAVERIRARKNA